MALTASGQISFGDIATELSISQTNVALATASTTGINSNSTSKPNGTAPHSISEFYSYDHSATSGGEAVTEYTLYGPSQDREAVCFTETTITKYKDGNGETVSTGDVFYNEDPGTSTFDAEGGWYGYFNDQFGMIVVIEINSTGDVVDNASHGCG